MNSLFHAEESSFRTAKRIAVVVAGLVILGLAMWAGLACRVRPLDSADPFESSSGIGR